MIIVGELWTNLWELARTSAIFGQGVDVDGDGTQDRVNNNSDMANVKTATGLDISANALAANLNQRYQDAFADSCLQMTFLASVASPILNKICQNGEMSIEAGLMNALPSSIQ